MTFRVDAYPTRDLHREGQAGPAGSGRVAERRHLCRDHLGAEPGAGAEAGHDGERHDRSRPQRRCSARAVGGAAVPADRGDADGPGGGPEGPRDRPVWRIRRLNQRGRKPRCGSPTAVCMRLGSRRGLRRGLHRAPGRWPARGHESRHTDSRRGDHVEAGGHGEQPPDAAAGAAPTILSWSFSRL